MVSKLVVAVSKLVVAKPSGQYQKQLLAAKAASEATRCGQALQQL